MKCYFVIPFLIGIQLASSLSFDDIEKKVGEFRRKEELLRSKAFPNAMAEIFNMPEFKELNEKLKEVALRELAYFEENGIDIKKLHRSVKNKEGYKTTKDILRTYSAALELFASMPLKAKLETSLFNALERGKLYPLLREHHEGLKYCNHEEDGRIMTMVSFSTTLGAALCTEKVFKPIDPPNMTFPQLFHSFLLKAGDFKAAEDMPDFAWRKTVYDQLSIRRALLERDITPKLLIEMYKESCLTGISHDRYKVVAGARGIPNIYDAKTNNEDIDFLGVFNSTLKDFNALLLGAEGEQFRTKCGTRFTADLVWTAYSGLIDNNYKATIDKFNDEVAVANGKGLGHLIAAMDVLGDQYYIPETTIMKKYSAHTHAVDFINGVGRAKRPFLGSYGWNLFPLKSANIDNTYDIYLIAGNTGTPYHNNPGIFPFYPKIVADLMTEGASRKPVNICLLNMHYLQRIDMDLLKFMYERGVPIMVQGCDESLNGRRHYLNSYYLYLITGDLRTVVSAYTYSILNSGLDEERRGQLLKEFIADIKAFVRVGKELLERYDRNKQSIRNQHDEQNLRAPRAIE